MKSEGNCGNGRETVIHEPRSTFSHELRVDAVQLAHPGDKKRRSVSDLSERRRQKKAQDDGSCPSCGGPRVVCSPMGRECTNSR